MHIRFSNFIKANFKTYLEKKYPELKISDKKLFDCPFCKSDTAQLLHGRLNCYNVECSWSKVKGGDIFKFIRTITPTNALMDDEAITEYVFDLLQLEFQENVDDLLAGYHKAGWALIPLAPGTKMPPSGFEEWQQTCFKNPVIWKEWIDRGYGLGLKLGKDSNVMALDIDEESVKSKLPDIGKTLVNKTKKGEHNLYNYDPTFTKTLNKVLKQAGYQCELRVEGAYIVIPPSSVEGETRKWNDGKIIEMPQALKDFFIPFLGQQESTKEAADKIQQSINKNELPSQKLHGWDGCFNDSMIQFLGVMRKTMTMRDLERFAFSFNELFVSPLENKTVRSMLRQISKYKCYDKDELAKIVLERLEIIKEGSAFQISKTLNREQADIEEVLAYLEKEGKVIALAGNRFQKLKEAEWVTGYGDYGQPINFEVPYFSKYAYFDKGNMIIIGGKTGTGKTTLVGNTINEFYKLHEIPSLDLISTEAGSKIGKILEVLKVPEDFVHHPKSQPRHPMEIELRDNRVTIIDWLKPKDGDFAQTENTMNHFNNQLMKHSGLLIVLVQIRSSDGEFFAKDILDFYSSFTGRFLYPNGNDNLHPYISTSKIRDSKSGYQSITIPFSYDYSTKILIPGDSK